MVALPLFSGPQDVSQLDSLLNTLVNAINAAVSGAAPTSVPVVNGTTSATLPTSGVVILASTAATGAYTLGAPVRGQTVRLISNSTKIATVTGLFNKTKTKLTLTSTAGAKLPQLAVALIGLSTAAWGIYGVAGNVKST